MNRNLTKTLYALILCGALTYCNQPAQEQEAPAEQEQEAVHAEHTPKVSEGAVVIQDQPAADTLKGSLKAEVHGQIGNAHIMINYHSPAVRGRTIWGGLVAYDQVWVTGAHSATSLTTDKDITIGGKTLPAGKYALFTIPGKDEWTVIINKNWEQHLADDYSEAEDVLRIKVKPEATAQPQERLRYQIVSETDEEGAIVITWDKLKVSIPVAV
ncbi:DUF2911 domain-containing protein [Pontibacter sp. FD36]|uniref:DUF2911 domain-containing protein n=1 Tax=Pontibacter amylolyticus TaxID=1424080 RepID=A0ABQ1W754_9BACT|nr:MULTISPECIES: DUF2911 domain-containing protein [Pontibacter]MBF8961689.1 DUF2911 domain-containing protein [Pontibacter sp. FD36]GGG18488.1 hypothetical protein GCM10011323_23320 [Pontibacter amylolyticus]